MKTKPVWQGVAAALALSSMVTAALAAQTFTVSPQLWDRPRTGEAILKQPAVKKAVDAYLVHDGDRLVIEYGPGEDARFDARELHSWLIALAVEGDRVSLRRDLKSRKNLKIKVTP